MKKIFVLISILLILVTTSGAFAALNSLGEPFPSGSWGATFQENGLYNGTHYDFDAFRVEMLTPGASFANDNGIKATSNFSSPWSEVYPNYSYAQTVYVTASGQSTGYMTWNYHFSGLQTDSLQFIYQMHATGIGWIAPSTITTWNNGWSYQETSNSAPKTAVPEPMSVMLGIMGLGSIAGFRRLRRK